MLNDSILFNSTHECSVMSSVKRNIHPNNSSIHNGINSDNLNSTASETHGPTIENEWEYFSRKYG